MTFYPVAWYAYSSHCYYHGTRVRFVFEHVCPLPREAVFDFFANPANMHSFYGGSRRFRLLRHGGQVSVGAQTWLEMGVFGCMPVVLGFRHTVYEPPRRFAEAIIHGPFSQFTHTHEFDLHGCETLVRDTLDIELPWQYGGALSTHIVVAPMVRRMFAERARIIEHVVANGMMNAGLLTPMSNES